MENVSIKRQENYLWIMTNVCWLASLVYRFIISTVGEEKTESKLLQHHPPFIFKIVFI